MKKREFFMFAFLVLFCLAAISAGCGGGGSEGGSGSYTEETPGRSPNTVTQPDSPSASTTPEDYTEETYPEVEPVLPVPYTEPEPDEPEPDPLPVIKPDDDQEPDPEPETSSFTVVFMDVGTETERRIVARDEAVNEPEEPEKDGYSFIGWEDSEGYLFNFGSLIERDTVLNAEWAAIVPAEQEETDAIEESSSEGIASVQFNEGGILTDIEVEYSADAPVIVSISNLHSDDAMSNAPGIIGQPLEIMSMGSGDINGAVIRFHYDPDALECEPEDLGIIWYDETNKVLTLLNAEVTVNEDDNSVQAVTGHFSKYAVVNKKAWLEEANAKLPYAHTPRHIVLQVNISASMSGDKLAKTRETLQKILDTVSDGDYLSVSVFRLGKGFLNAWQIGITAEKQYVVKELYNMIDTLLKELEEIKEYASRYGGVRHLSNFVEQFDYGIHNYSWARFKIYSEMPESCQNFVIFFSDGLYSDSEMETLRDDKTLANYNRYGLKINTVSFGNDVNEANLKTIAETTGGIHINANDSEEAFNRIMARMNYEDSERPEEVRASYFDNDGDTLTNDAEKGGMHDQFLLTYKTDPDNPDTDYDGYSDSEEMGEYVSASGDVSGHFERVSDPNKATVKSRLANVFMSSYTERISYPALKKIALLTSFTDRLYGTIGNLECIYEQAENIEVEAFPSAPSNYEVETYIKKEEEIGYSGIKYTVMFLLSYEKEPSRGDTLRWRVTADNLAKPERTNEGIAYLEETISILEESAVESTPNIVGKSEARLALLEQEFMRMLLNDAEEGAESNEEDEELKAKLAAFSAQVKQYGGTVPDEVCEAFALAVLEVFDSGGNTIEKYKTDPDKLTQQLLTQIGASVSSGIKDIVVGDHVYTVNFTLTNQEGIGVDFAYVDRDGVPCATLVWSSSFDDMKTALAGYCTKLAQLNKGLWNEFLVNYVKYMFDQTGIKLDKKNIKSVVEAIENTIDGLCGDKDAANKAIENMKDLGKAKLKSTFLGENKFAKFVKLDIPNGQAHIQRAVKLQKLVKKLDKFRTSMKAYNLGKILLGESADPYNASAAFEDFKTAYKELGKDSFDVEPPLTEWPEGW